MCIRDSSNWHKISWINCLFFYFSVVRTLKKRGLPRKFARFALFRQIKKSSFNLMCVLDKILISTCIWISEPTLKKLAFSGHVLYVTAARRDQKRILNLRNVFKYLVDYMLKLESEYREHHLAGRDVQNTVKCHSSPFAYRGLFDGWLWAEQAKTSFLNST